jgi:hypothetical protein
MPSETSGEKKPPFLGGFASILSLLGITLFFSGWIYRWAYFSYFSLDVNAQPYTAQSFLIVPIQIYLGRPSNLLKTLLVVLALPLLISLSVRVLNGLQVWITNLCCRLPWIRSLPFRIGLPASGSEDRQRFIASLLDEATAGKSTPKSPVDRTAQDKPAKPAQAAAPAAAQSTSPATAEAPRATETRARTAAETSTIAAAPPATAPPVAAPPSAPPVVPPAVIPPAKGAEGKAKPTVTVLNPTKAEEPPVPAPAGGPGTESLTAPPAASDGVKVATGPTGKSAVPKSGAKAGKKPKCNVFTASYGGQKSVIIEAVTGESVNYTVLDVNEGSEARETEAYVAAYAKGSKSIGEFKNQTLALDKAFELCPEG